VFLPAPDGVPSRLLTLVEDDRMSNQTKLAVPLFCLLLHATGTFMPPLAYVNESAAAPRSAPPAGPATRRPYGPGAVQLELRRLATTGKVLYVAAHPDDENTRLIAWLGGALGLDTTYLSLTRGDGGQNLIGDEQDELLGLLRTHELLAARARDGGHQRFTRARDFGYSKSADETLTKWGKEEVLADVVWAIRTVRPDVVITRFSPQPPNHGHHLASAILAAEAIEAAADPKRFPEQLGRHAGQLVGPHRVARLLHNVPNWNQKPGVVDPKLATVPRVDVGSFEPLLGAGWGEIAADARTQHKSQGFGSAPQRGQQLEHLQWLAGSQPTGLDPFQGLDFSWTRFASAGVPKAKLQKVQTLVQQASKEVARGPALAALPTLVSLHELLSELAPSVPVAADQLQRVAELVAGIAGVHVQATTPLAEVVPGQRVSVSVSAIQRLGTPLTWRDVSLHHGREVIAQKSPEAALAADVSTVVVLDAQVPAAAQPTTPYWLQQQGNGLLYQNNQQSELGQPVLAPPLLVTIELVVAGKGILLSRPVVQQTIDPVHGEQIRPVEVVPALAVSPREDVTVVPLGQKQTVTVRAQAGRSGVRGQVRLQVPSGYVVQPAVQAVSLSDPGDVAQLQFQVTAPKAATQRVVARLEVDTGDGWRPGITVREVRYPHVPLLSWRRPAEVVLQPLELTLAGKRIGYVPGPETRTADAMRAAGWDITLLTEHNLADADLNKLDAVVIGSRALNQSPKLAQHQKRLWQWVKQGGVLLVQYQTQSRIGPLKAQIGPYPLEIGRDRVTDETAPLTWLDPVGKHLTFPNKLTPADWDGWVQERGLYFASSWDKAWQPLLSCQDPGEAPLQGALLQARHGKGKVLYTGLALFRQLPAGVPGAYRLLANLLAK
jgi:LmbE family N-acetylglucosaminyl deacetylase